MKIVWDEPKRLRNVIKHGYDFASLDEAFFGTARLERARENRVAAYGPFGNRLVCVVFALLGSEAISIISMRPASRAERELYYAQIRESDQ